MQKLRISASLLAFVFLIHVSLPSFAGLFSLTESQEVQIGAQAAADVERKQKVLKDAQVTNYIQDIGNKLVKNSERSNLNYRFRVIDSDQINAFALPGGFIYINSGLIKNADTENELVGVVAHEIGHVSGRHGVTQVARAQKATLAFGLARVLLSRVSHGKILYNGAQLATQGAFLKFSRDHEREADRRGAYMMHRSGWDTAGMVSFFDKLSKKSGKSSSAFFSTHPSPAERRNNIADLTAAWKGDGKVNSPEFQKIKARV